jgi:hypothetical protein
MEMSHPSIPLKGLVVDWKLPSRALFREWVNVEDNTIDINYSEVIETFPQDIFRELETIRRTFYKRVHPIIMYAYTLKLLSVDDLPKFHDAVEATRKRLEQFDKTVEHATNSDYYKAARQYLNEKHGRGPKIIINTSKRFSVMLMPFRLDSLVWDQFLTDEMKAKKAALSAQFRQSKKQLTEALAKIENQLQAIEVEKSNAKAELIEAYGNANLPFDVATLKIERQDLTQQVKDLEYKKKDIQRQINRLDQNRKQENRRWRRTSNWTIRQAEKTQDEIHFDLFRAWREIKEQLKHDGIDTYDMDPRFHTQRFIRLRDTAITAKERIYTVQPAHSSIRGFTTLIELFTKAIEGHNIKKELEEYNQYE